jgi:hypothetical protein
VGRVELFAKQYVPFGLLSTLRELQEELGENHTMQMDEGAPKYSIWASVSMSYNYVGPAHVDKDAYFSCLFCVQCT